MLAYHDTREGGPDRGRVRAAFTDVRTDLALGAAEAARTVRRLEREYAVRVAGMHQVHGATVAAGRPGELPDADGLVTDVPGVALLVRVADCVPVLLADAARGVVGAAHAGRRGVELGVVAATVSAMRARGALDLVAWVGPHVCGGCYEVPAAMRAEVAARVPATYAKTRRGTPALDLGAGVAAQLHAAGVEVVHVAGCTLEDPAWPSHRRDATPARFAGLIWTEPAT